MQTDGYFMWQEGSRATVAKGPDWAFAPGAANGWKDPILWKNNVLLAQK